MAESPRGSGLAAREGEVVSLSFADATAALQGVARLQNVGGAAHVLVAVLAAGRPLAAVVEPRGAAGDGLAGAEGLSLSLAEGGRLSARFRGWRDGEGAFELGAALSPWIEQAADLDAGGEPASAPAGGATSGEGRPGGATSGEGRPGGATGGEGRPGGAGRGEGRDVGGGSGEGRDVGGGSGERRDVAGADGVPRLFTVNADAGAGLPPRDGETETAAPSGQLRIWRPEPSDAPLVRELGAWFPSGRGLALHAVRPSSRGGHDRELVDAVIDEGDPCCASAFEDPRLSTTYGADGGVRRAALELWPSEESDYARRAAGEALGAATAFTGPIGSGRKAHRLRYDVAFLAWRMEGEEGLGSYTLVRRVAAS